METVVGVYILSPYGEELVTIISDPKDSMAAAQVFKEALIANAAEQGVTLEDSDVGLQELNILELPEAMEKLP